METKTPPNTTGFNRKPNRKSRHTARNGKSHHAKEQRILTPKEEERMKCLGGMLFLIYAATQIAEIFSDSPVDTQ